MIKSATTIWNTLYHFTDISGLKANYAKSKVLFSTNTSSSTVDKKYRTLGIGTVCNKYLGFTIKPNIGSPSIYFEILNKIETKFAGWKSKLLSTAGKVTLIKCTISSIPKYQMHCLKFPQSIYTIKLTS